LHRTGLTVTHGQLRTTATKTTTIIYSAQAPVSASQHNANDYLGFLIEEVRIYRCLWDSSCRAFKEIQKKQQALNQIAQKFNVNGI